MKCESKSFMLLLCECFCKMDVPPTSTPLPNRIPRAGWLIELYPAREEYFITDLFKMATAEHLSFFPLARSSQQKAESDGKVQDGKIYFPGSWR